MYLSFIKITVHCSSSGFFSEIFRKILVTQTLGFCLSIVCRGHLASQNRFCFGISVTGKISELVFMNSSYNLFSTLPQAAWERERGGTVNFVSLVYQLCWNKGNEIENKIRYLEVFHFSPDLTFIELIRFPVALHHWTQSYVM